MAKTDLTREDFERWKFQHRLVSGPLDRIEQDEREMLKRRGLPIDPVKLFDIKDRTARRAMFVLATVEETRRLIGVASDDPTAAAFAALSVGLLASRSATHAALLAMAPKGGKKRGQQIGMKAARHDGQIRTHYQRWTMSDELQSQYPSPARYIRLQMNKQLSRNRLTLKTVHRRLKIIRTKAGQ
jgi:hypothetical protein